MKKLPKAKKVVGKKQPKKKVRLWAYPENFKQHNGVRISDSQVERYVEDAIREAAIEDSYCYVRSGDVLVIACKVDDEMEVFVTRDYMIAGFESGDF